MCRIKEFIEFGKMYNGYFQKIGFWFKFLRWEVHVIWRPHFHAWIWHDVRKEEWYQEDLEKFILMYLDEHQNETIYPSDIAFEHNLDARQVFETCIKLKKEGKIMWVKNRK